jgi:HAD superfamily phosphatase
MPRPLLVFDMDGVLVDVGESYRETIQQTVAHFSGRRPTREEIQEWKNRGGWNDDWLLSHALLRAYGCEVPFETVRDQFQRLFLGDHGDGLITRERWIARAGVLESLAERFDFALFTGRPREDAQLTLGRFAGQLRFDPLIGMYEVEQPKPSPDGLLRIARQAPGRKLWYIGDTVDDARAAQAAGVSFIGISAPGKPRRGELTRLLREHGAVAVLDDINQLATVL